MGGLSRFFSLSCRHWLSGCVQLRGFHLCSILWWVFLLSGVLLCSSAPRSHRFATPFRHGALLHSFFCAFGVPNTEVRRYYDSSPSLSLLIAIPLSLLSRLGPVHSHDALLLTLAVLLPFFSTLSVLRLTEQALLAYLLSICSIVPWEAMVVCDFLQCCHVRSGRSLFQLLWRLWWYVIRFNAAMVAFAAGQSCPLHVN